MTLLLCWILQRVVKKVRLQEREAQPHKSDSTNAIQRPIVRGQSFQVSPNPETGDGQISGEATKQFSGRPKTTHQLAHEQQKQAEQVEKASS
jgi:hypothetical protein